MAIRAQDADAGGGKPVEELGARMTVGILLAHGDHRKAGTNCCQKLRQGRVPTAVVGHFQEAGLECAAGGVREDLRFGLTLNVARQQEHLFAKSQAKKERVVVLSGLHNFPWPGFRPQNAFLDAIPVETCAAALVHDRDSFLTRKVFERTQTGVLHFAADPQSADAEVLEDSSESSEVILMRVGESDDVEALDSARPQKGRNGVLAGIGTGGHGAASIAQKASASVHQHGVASR